LRRSLGQRHLASDFITNDTTLTVSGTNTALGAGEKTQISTDGTTWIDVVQNTGTTWTYIDPASHTHELHLSGAGGGHRRQRGGDR
jgi:hypothetical protein